MHTKTRNKLFFTIPYIAWLAVFVVIPIVLLVFQSLTNANGNFTLGNFQEFITSDVYLPMAFNSVLYAVIITAITLLISFPAAYVLSRLKHRQLWLMIIILPTWINVLLKVYAFLGLLSKTGIFNQILQAVGLGTHNLLFNHVSFILVAVYLELPFMLLPIYNSINEIDPDILRASRYLGAKPINTMRSLVFPLSINGIKSGIQAVFIPSLSLFMLTTLIGGNKVMTLGSAIELHFIVTQNWHMGSTIAVVLIIAMVITMLLTRERGKRK